MLKKYMRREEPPIKLAVCAITCESDSEDDGEVLGLSSDANVETYEDVNINPELTPEQERDVKELVYEYQSIFSSIPGKTNLIQHKIVLTDDQPIQNKPYPIPYE